jgi:indole-3-glycerol phosphate synthase
MPENRLSENLLSEKGAPRLPSILQKILAAKRLRLERQKRRLPLRELKAALPDLPPTRDFASAVRDPRSRGQAVAIIAEIKRRSPSRGLIRRELDPASMYRAYVQGGADACSVLTEEDYFGGALDHLRELRPLAEIPLLRKDFVFDPYQLYETRTAGADAILLIAAALEDERLRGLLETCGRLELQALVEVHTREELDRALGCGARMVGINNRNLSSFEVDIEASLKLAPHLPAGLTAVSESGIHGPEEIRRLAAAGIRAFLVGEHLMRAADPAAALRRLKEAL